MVERPDEKKITDRPANWEKRRKLVFERDNGLCQNCHREVGTLGERSWVAHHCVPVSQGGNHFLSNLQLLCKECHDFHHGKGKGRTWENSLFEETYPSRIVVRHSQRTVGIITRDVRMGTVQNITSTLCSEFDEDLTF
ncbi:HNH endonuclease [Halorussus sp. AFM4]|uniref:HNH endonuclease n=1 Tax=Halorussus sp. AFM4 TaxID=3421651 RepID=UPI003EBF9E71